MFMILETLIMLGIVIGGVAGTGYLGVLFCAKVAEMGEDIWWWILGVRYGKTNLP